MERSEYASDEDFVNSVEQAHQEANQTSETLGGIIKQARDEAALTVRGLSEFIGSIDHSYITRIELNERTPSEAVIHQLANALSLNVNELLLAAGRLTPRARDYLKQHSLARQLFNKLAEENTPNEVLEELLRQVSDFSETQK